MQIPRQPIHPQTLDSPPDPTHPLPLQPHSDHLPDPLHRLRWPQFNHLPNIERVLNLNGALQAELSRSKNLPDYLKVSL
ncbi:hypothetical protein [Acaryochloris marina]|uniref:hypothetical protein n=1 Tax=Acaryochloris marina TaxID=155978 RepID=UPI001BAE75AD|nr:hypothetical protein [Acaryochloris marina]QUY45706.1 hypothetical protein I1H34_28515 [Acaryochloris marina S15]